MTTDIDTEERAFPFAAGLEHPGACGGMSLRDYFASKAMQGFCVSFPDCSPAEIARMAYDQADCMLIARRAALSGDEG